MGSLGQNESRTEGLYGPGSWTDTSFIPVPEECKRLLRMLARDTPGFTDSQQLIEDVTFSGDDLPNLPGPLKSQALTSVMHAMVGIVGHEILQIRGIPTDGKTFINTNMGGLYPGSPSLISVDGLDGPGVMQLPTVPHLRAPPSVARDMDYDHYMVGNSLRLRSSGIYPTATKDVWYQLHGSTNPYAALHAIGIEKDFIDADASADMSHDKAYEIIKERMMKYQAKEIELMMIEQSESCLAKQLERRKAKSSLQTSLAPSCTLQKRGGRLSWESLCRSTLWSTTRNCRMHLPRHRLSSPV